MIRVLIADSHPVVREGLRSFLCSDNEIVIVGEVACGKEAVKMALVLRPDVILIELPASTGSEEAVRAAAEQLTAIKAIHVQAPETALVMFVDSPEQPSIPQALRAGATGCLHKNVGPAEVRQVIRAAASGIVSFPRQASVSLLYAMRSSPHSTQLTEREQEVLGLLAQGCSNKEIARQLHISDDTTKSHIRHIFGKLGAQNRVQAVLAANRLGLVEEEELGFLHPLLSAQTVSSSGKQVVYS